MSSERSCRDITDDEIAHYLEFGWVKLTGFVRLEVAASMLALAKTKMGEDGDSNAPTEHGTDFFNPEAGHGLTDPVLRPVIDEVGSSANRLLARGNGKGIRYFADYFAAKLPAGKTYSHRGTGTTDVHQDFTSWALDRTGGMTFWFALSELSPDSGTMSFLSGSHKGGTFGHYESYGDGGLLGLFPELLDRYPLTGPTAYAPGDVTVHSSLIVHGAGLNLTCDPRWAWLVIVNPADALWNGGVADFFDYSGMHPLQAPDDERFPVIAS